MQFDRNFVQGMCVVYIASNAQAARSSGILSLARFFFKRGKVHPKGTVSHPFARWGTLFTARATNARRPSCYGRHDFLARTRGETQYTRSLPRYLLGMLARIHDILRVLRIINPFWEKNKLICLCAAYIPRYRPLVVPR